MTGPQRRSRVVLVGPVRPFRGGIAHYTESLAQALRDVADLRVVSFRKLYPARLYPGASDRDPAASAMPGADYLLSATDPRTWRRTADSIAAGRPDVVVFTWWTLYWQPWTAYMARRLRGRGIRVVYLCHNIGDHGAGGLRHRLNLALLATADAYVVHSREIRDELRAEFPDRPVMQRAHPVYDRFPAPKHEWKPRGRLDLLFFGFIRPYKGLDLLMDAVELAADDGIRLTVVGESWEDTRELEERARSLGVETVLRYVSDDEAADYFSRADLVVLPYRSATGSGVVSAAYHYQTPVLATRVGGIPDVVDETTGVLVEPDDPTALAAALTRLTRDDCRALAVGVRAFTLHNTWSGFAHALDEFLTTVVEGRRD